MDRVDEITQKLFSLHSRGIKYDLDRMKQAVARLGNPEHACPSIHVAGTNGKGSVCAYLEAMLHGHGFKTGCYTSPHLVGFEERFRINGTPITTDEWVEAYHATSGIIEELRLTFFEAATLMAFLLFAHHGVEWAIYETGLGGRLDATNVVVPRVSVITTLDLDHTDLLGNDLMAIATEKLGIVKHRTPLVMAMPGDTAIRDLALIHALRNETTATFVERDEAHNLEQTSDGISFDWHGQRYLVKGRGTYQIENSLLALSALRAAGFTDLGSLGRGLANAWIPGRFQVACVRDTIMVFDVGHNPQAAQSFARELRSSYPQKTVCCVVGIMKDKDFRPMIEAYAGIAQRLILTAPAIDRAASPHMLFESVSEAYRGQTLCIPGVAQALETALSGPEEVIVVTGSFYTVGEAMTTLGVTPYPRSRCC